MEILKNTWNSIIHGVNTAFKFITDIPLKTITTALDFITYPVTSIMSYSRAHKDLPQHISLTFNAFENGLSKMKNDNLNHAFNKISFEIIPSNKTNPLIEK